MNERDYRITFYDRSYWITEEERHKYLTDRGKPDCDYVALRDGVLILPIKFQDIVHISAIEESQEIERQIKAGARFKPDSAIEYAD